MEKSVAKWLARAGALFIMLGFFLPSVTVSCSALGVTQSKSFSLNDIAGGANNLSNLTGGLLNELDAMSALLYIVPLGALAAMGIAFIPPRDRSQRLLFLAGQTIGLGISLLGVLVTLLSLSGQIQELQNLGFDVNPAFGILVLLLGYGLGGFGTFLDFFQPGLFNSSGAPPARAPAYSPGSFPPDPAPASSPVSFAPDSDPAFSYPTLPPAPPLYSPPPSVSPSGARLELVRGSGPNLVPIQGSDFSVGRAPQNQLRVADPRVSGMQCRLRFAQGDWFIQDQKSSNGTFVNGKRTAAQRIKNGDQIQVGDTMYVFRN
jgi:hypothetical protein